MLYNDRELLSPLTSHRDPHRYEGVPYGASSQCRHAVPRGNYMTLVLHGGTLPWCIPWRHCVTVTRCSTSVRAPGQVLASNVRLLPNRRLLMPPDDFMQVFASVSPDTCPPTVRSGPWVTRFQLLKCLSHLVTDSATHGR